MSTKLQAMLWELWKTSRVELLNRFGIQLLGVLFISFTPFMDLENESENRVINGILMMILSIQSVAFSTWWLALERQSTGFSFRLGFARPVSTWMLVLVPVLFTMCAAGISFLLPTGLLILLDGRDLALMQPALLVVVFSACLMAASWAPTTLPTKAAATFLVCSLLFAGLLLQQVNSGMSEPLLMAAGYPQFYEFGWFNLLFPVIVLAAIGITIRGVEYQRHGDRWWIEQVCIDVTHRLRSRPQRQSLKETASFSGRLAAQSWYEMRRIAPATFSLAVCAPLIVFVFVTVIPMFDRSWHGQPYVWLLALLLSPSVFQLIACDGALSLRKRQGALKFSSFDATRSLRSDRLIMVKLLVVAACAFASWLLMLVAACAHTYFVDSWQTWRELFAPLLAATDELPVYWWLGGLSNVIFLYISSTSILLAMGLWIPLHPKLFIALMLTIYGHGVLAVWDGHNGWQYQTMWLAYGYVVAIGVTTLCLAALFKAFRSCFLSLQLFSAVFALWLVYVGSVVYAYFKLAPDSTPLALVCLGAASLLIPLATTAFAPIAYAAHRHA